MKNQLWNNQVTFINENKNVKPSWFGIGILFNKKYKNKKNKIIKKLNSLGIETRPLISGNFTKQPAIKKYNILRKGISFTNAELVNDLGFFIGLSINTISSSKLKRFTEVFFKSFNQ